MKGVTQQLERLERICQRLRGRPLSVEELQIELEKALDNIVQILKNKNKKGD
jgi:hypothetical protein